MSDDSRHKGMTGVFAMIYGKPKPADEPADEPAEPAEPAEPRSRSAQAYLDSLKEGQQ